jgi:membrane associated rhomboid family serine protease
MIFEKEQDNAEAEAIFAVDAAEMHLWSLVLSAVAIPHAAERTPAGHVLWVSRDHLHAAQHQIYLYQEENSGQGQVEERYRDKDHFRPPTLLIMALFVLVFDKTGPWQEHSLWFSHGAVDRQAILAGQWWRLLTALTLHADLVHLVGNVVIGGFFVHLLCRVVGTGLGWALIFLVGASGNLLNILVRHSQHLSVGFSTGVFGAVGLLCGLESVRRRRWQGVLLALGAGLGLLAMLGAGGERVDLGAHLWGFGVGVVLGGLTSLLRGALGHYPGFRLQCFLFLAVLVMLWQAWSRALVFG